MWGARNSPHYHRSVKYDKNFVITPQGSLLMRGGSKSLSVPSVAGGDGRLIEFGNFVLLFTDRYLQIFDVSGPVPVEVQVTQEEFLVNGSFASGSTGWSVYGNNAHVVFENDAVKLINSTISDQAHCFQDFTLTESKEVVVSFSVISGGLLGAWFKISRTPWLDAHLDDIIFSEVKQDAGDFSYRITLAAGVYGFACGAVGYDNGDTFTTSATVDTISIATVAASQGEFGIVSPWPVSASLKKIQFAEESAADRIYFAHPNIRQHYLQRSAANIWGLQPITFINTPSTWQGTNWPGCVELHAGRLIFAGAPDQGNRIWTSKANSLFDFRTKTNDEVLPGDAIDFKVATKGRVTGLVSGRALVVCTDRGEHVLVDRQGYTAFDATNFACPAQSHFGSTGIQPISADTHALYVSEDRRKVRAIVYANTTNGWDTRDVTFMAEHITAAKVKELHFARHPDGLILALMDDGSYAACTYAPSDDAAKSVSAWWRVAVGADANLKSEVLSAAVTSGADGATLWHLVKGTRLDLGNATSFWLQKIDLTDRDSAVTLDFSVDLSVSLGSDGLGQVHDQDRLSPLVGLKVVVAAGEGVVSNGFTVLPDGFVSGLPADLVGGTVTVGLVPEVRAITLPKSGWGVKKHTPTIGLSLVNSIIPKVNSKRAPEFDPARDVGDTRITGEVELTELGWSSDASFTIEQDVPFRTEIVALYDKTQANNR
jgi:hypothetical protein